MQIIPHPPKYSTCWYCLSKIEGSHDSETSVRYVCLNHSPLHVNWHCQRKTAGEWFFNSFVILLPDQFRLLYPIHNNQAQEFYLDEYSKNEFNNFKGSWISFRAKTYPVDWVLTQTTTKLLSILQMYRTFS